MMRKGIGAMKKTPGKTGVIFDIQKYSIHDGPGIRTIVFLKGCPLRCVWCSNPESQSPAPEVMWRQQFCRYCGKCNHLCPRQAVTDGADGKKAIDRGACDACGVCDENCYAESIQLSGRYVDVDEVLKEVEKDAVFYEQSGGGLTLGGGEPLMQPEFARALLAEAKARGLHTVVETAGYVPWENIEAVRPFVDLFLFDVKHMDSTAHKEYTGAGNELVLENARKLAGAGGNMCIRVPVIPGMNDSVENLEKTAAFAREIGARDIELLAFHKMGSAKYANLGGTYPMEDAQPQTEEEMKRLKLMVKKAFGE